MNKISEWLVALAWVTLGALLGGVLGFYLGFSMYGRVLGVYIPISDIFDSSNIILLGGIRNNIVMATSAGALIGAILGVVADALTSKREVAMPANNVNDELTKLFELKQNGAITNEEYEKLKKKVMGQ